MTRAGTAIHVHIQELVLHGIASPDARDISDAVVAELTQLFAADGVPGSMLAMNHGQHGDAGSIDVAGTASGASVGRDIARAVYAVRPAEAP